MTSKLKITGPERIKRKKEEDVGIDDQPTKKTIMCNANVGDLLASQKSETRSNNIILNLPDIPFKLTQFSGKQHQ